MLPAPLAERLEPKAPAPRAGRFVVYWMRVAARAHENPALDVALSAAKALGLPVFVYHALAERYRYASDRLHTFFLEGAREVQRALRERGIGYAFHLERPGHRVHVLKALAKDAALVVADFLPMQPLLRWDAEVARQAPLWRVDASCLAPIWRFPTPVDRALAFRAAAKDEWARRVRDVWRDAEPPGPAFLPELPFEPVDLQVADLASLVAGCEVDHTVAPVHHTPGGTTAGLERWRRFVDSRLDAYARDRDDPLREGTSRMSAYLHFGHVSVFRLARDAAAHRTEGAEKFLDELLTWRELAWHFCWHTPAPESVDALPAWARETLRAHESDRREALPSWEQLARAQTGDTVWDAAQRQLLTHGELHNAVRMTWGKRLLEWTRSAKEALALLFDLNHRYALDGRDPSSVGGILWCLGGFDRPFSPETPVLGAVRPRPTAEQAKRFDVAEYERRVHRPPRGSPLTVAVVGAGVAGAAAARALKDAGHAVVLFDKGREPGGRLSTHKGSPHRFDHGAPCFTVKDERFARWARAWWHERVLTEWSPVALPENLEKAPSERERTTLRPAPSPGDRGPLRPSDSTEGHSQGAGRAGHKSPLRLIATPSNAALVSRLHHQLDVRLGVTVGELKRDAERWRLKDAEGESLGEYEVAVVALPAPQAAALVDPTSFALASRLREVAFEACWAVLLAFESPTGVEWDLQEGMAGPLERLWRDSSKPDRRGAGGERWVLHATGAWSQRHLEAPAEEVTAMLLDAFFSATGAPRQPAAFSTAHRWRYARAAKPLGEACVWDEALKVAVCGDWCLGRDVESAFLSGSAAAGRINALPAPSTEESGARPSTRVDQLRLL
ncbi:MAG: FAD-dependent oxidoreductase [Myxococcota bacterium]